MISKLARRFAVLALLPTAVLVSCESSRRVPDGPLDDVVAGLLPAMERLSGLTAREPVRTARVTRAEADAYVRARLDRYLPPERLEGMRRSYVMLGLLPDTLDLHRMLLELYGEQVAGYYDPGTKTLYAVESATASPIEPVLAHELVHALQDQYANLDSLITRPGTNDRQTAAQAAIEGHATLAMFAWLAESAGGGTIDPASIPDPGAAVASVFASQNGQFPVFTRAPRIIRETLIFPYAAGASFVQALWRDRAGERPAPFGALMPTSTEQVVDPIARFLGVRDEPTEIRHGPVAGWNEVYENTLGAFETGIFLEVTADAAAGLSRGWDGDRFTLYDGPAGSVLVWTSIWDDTDSADLFVQSVRGAPHVVRPIDAWRLSIEGRPGVRIVIGTGRSSAPDPAVHCADESGDRVAC